MTLGEQSGSIWYAIFLLVRSVVQFLRLYVEVFSHLFELIAGNHAGIEIRGHVLCFWHALEQH